jgi:hypothetical protein
MGRRKLQTSQPVLGTIGMAAFTDASSETVALRLGEMGGRLAESCASGQGRRRNRR